jgi:hypothetical protein
LNQSCSGCAHFWTASNWHRCCCSKVLIFQVFSFSCFQG